jgi:predicted PurR-regulated permease PerM
MDTERREHWSNRRIILTAVGVAIAVTIIWRLPGSFAYVAERLTELAIVFIAAVVLAYILKPPVDFIAESPRLGAGSPRARSLAALLVLLMLIGSLILGTWRVVDKISDEAVGWSQVLHLNTKKEREKMRKDIQQQINNGLDYYNNLLPAEIRPAVNEGLNSLTTSLLLSVSEGAKRTVHWLRLIAELLLVPILTFYFLTDAKGIRRELWLLVPPRYERQVQSLLTELDQVMNGYVRGQIILCTIATIVVMLGMLALRMRFAFTLGLAAGVCRAIPFVGPVLGAIPLIIAALIQKDINIAAIVVIGSSVMHFVESKFITPKVIGYKVGLHPVIIIAALMIGWEFFGIIGMFLAAPVVAMLKITLVHYRMGWRNQESTPETEAIEV